MARRLLAELIQDKPYLTADVVLGYVKRWESGKGGLSRKNRAACARVFEIPEDELFAPAERPRRPDQTAVLSEAMSLSEADERRIDARYVQFLRHLNQAIVQVDITHGANDLLPLARRVFRHTHRRLSTGAYEPRVERDLVAATGETGEIIAWLAFDADQQALSRHAIHEALLLSRQAGDRTMELFELTHLSMQSVHVRRPAEALRIAEELLGGANPSPRVAALLNIRRGRALAQMGDERRSMDVLHKARTDLTDSISPRDPYWTWWVTEGEIAWHLGMARADLGDWGGALPLFHESVSRRASYRRAKYNDLAHLLHAQIHAADWPDIEPVMQEIDALTGEIASTRTTNLLRRITQEIPQASAPSTVTDMAHTLNHRLEHTGACDLHPART